MATNLQQYREYRKNRTQAALFYQDFVVEMCAQHINLILQVYGSKEFQWGVGESRQGAEIKFDDKHAATGNLFIEIAEKAEPREGDFVPSGIYRNDNSWLYIIGNYDVIYIFPKKYLQILHQLGRYRVFDIKLGTARGFLLPPSDSEKYASVVLRPECSEKVAKIVKDTSAIGQELHALLLDSEQQSRLFREFPA